jgi:hypothetical protein
VSRSLIPAGESSPGHGTRERPNLSCSCISANARETFFLGHWCPTESVVTDLPINDSWHGNKDWRGVSLKAGSNMCRMCATLATPYPQVARTNGRRASADTNPESQVPLITLWRRCNLEPATFSLGSRQSMGNKEHSVSCISFWR